MVQRKRQGLYARGVPGFSWHNMHPNTRLNLIPRLKGKFLWQQYYLAQKAGTKMIYQAMFDEINEGTAI